MEIINICITVSFTIKTLLHKYINYLNTNDLTLNGIMDSSFGKFIWFYTDPVTKETIYLKKICNILYIIFLILVFIKIISSVL